MQEHLNGMNAESTVEGAGADDTETDLSGSGQFEKGRVYLCATGCISILNDKTVTLTDSEGNVLTDESGNPIKEQQKMHYYNYEQLEKMIEEYDHAGDRAEQKAEIKRELLNAYTVGDYATHPEVKDADLETSGLTEQEIADRKSNKIVTFYEFEEATAKFRYKLEYGDKVEEDYAIGMYVPQDDDEEESEVTSFDFKPKAYRLVEDANLDYSSFMIPIPSSGFVTLSSMPSIYDLITAIGVLKSCEIF